MFRLLQRLVRSFRSTWRRSRAARPCLEQLEDRLTPSAGPRAEYLLELVNRMRTNPAAELGLLLHSGDANVNNALAYFHVDPAVLAQEWAGLKAAPPLAWNDPLGNAALAHSQLMLPWDQQQHQLPGEADPGTRMAAAGYAPAQTFNWGENIYAYAESVFFAHAGLAIDWGATPTGIQSPPGHRNNILSTDFQEMGVGLVDAPAGMQTGPLLITEDFGGDRPNQGNPFLLGSVFKDANGDGFYNPGEGLAGINLTIHRIGGTFTTTTTAAGAYQIQLPPGSYSVGGSGLAPRIVTIGTANVMVNFVWNPPAVPTWIAPSGVTATTTPTFTWTASTGASRYDLWVKDSTAGVSQVIRRTILAGTSFRSTTPLVPGHHYQAMVRAYNSLGAASAWSTGTFTIVLPPPPGAPTVTAPPSPSLFPIITWTLSAGAVRYDFVMNDTSAGISPVIGRQNLSTNSFTPGSPLLHGHQYQVWVRALDSCGQHSTWSGLNFRIA